MTKRTSTPKKANMKRRDPFSNPPGKIIHPPEPQPQPDPQPEPQPQPTPDGGVS
jgi:hypothetical protein